MDENRYIGKPVKRVDGLAKVTGSAKYAAEFNGPGLLHGVIISSSIAKGSISEIDASAALQIPGVIKVYSHKNVPSLAFFNFSYFDMNAPPGRHFRYFQSDRIFYNHQPIALVVAETFELARYAVTLVEVSYEQTASQTSLHENRSTAREMKGFKYGFRQPKNRGNFERAFENAEIKLNRGFSHGAEHHNPLEMHASTVIYQDNGKLVVYDKTQGVFNSLKYVAGVFSLPYKDVEILSPFVGGAFGSALRPQYQLFAAALAALDLKRSVRVALTREQMFSFGHRPATIQEVKLGAGADGRLQGLSHTAVSETSRFEDYVENVVTVSASLYHCKHIHQSHLVVPLDIYTPLDMRAPGGATGAFAIECAMDELAEKLKIDPLELRLINYSDRDSNTGRKYSSKELKQCYLQGAEKFGWSNRYAAPRSMREGHLLKGWGMASGIWDSGFLPGRASAVITKEGKLTVSCGTADIGTGTYTVMSQIAADTLSMCIDDVTFKLGDTSLPFALVEGGSATAGSIGTAVQKACLQLKKKLTSIVLRLKPGFPADAQESDLVFSEGSISLRADQSRSITYGQVLALAGKSSLKVTSTGLPSYWERMRHASAAHAAVFAEVLVDESLGVINVSRVVSAVAAGRILNPVTARSQIIGGVVWGISMALQEDTHLDQQFGRFMNHSLAEYHIPVNADIANIDVIFVEETDYFVNPIGVKGIGEVGTVGVAAAVLNAIHHATGRRQYTLPVQLHRFL